MVKKIEQRIQPLHPFSINSARSLPQMDLLNSLRALDSISLLRDVVTTQMQFDFQFLLVNAMKRVVTVWRPNFTLVIVFSFRIFFQSRKLV